jgi:hypothetical protein
MLKTKDGVKLFVATIALGRWKAGRWRFIVLAVCVLAVAAGLPVMAQNNANSPYTRLGYGELADRSFAAGRAMGGLGVGLRNEKQVNVLNPASYTAVDSLTFIFDFGAHAQVSRFKQGDISQSNTNGNVEYMAMLFRLRPGLAFSAGLLPFSYVGYRFVGEELESGVPSFIGSGALTELYAGLAWEPWRRRLSIGANAGYLFGRISHQRNVSFSSGEALDIVNVLNLAVRDFKWEAGIQYTHPLGKARRLIFGASYAPNKQLSTDFYEDLQVGASTAGGYATSDTLNKLFSLPQAYAFGVSFVKENRFTVGAEFRLEEWSKAKFPDEQFRNKKRLAIGAEYIPDILGRSFFQRVKYRFGMHAANSYVLAEVAGQEGSHGYDEYGVSFGFGLPIRTGFSGDDNRSAINLAVQYVTVRPEVSGMVAEDYFRFTLNFTFNEMWFYKLKMR